MTDKLILVDELDNEIGVAGKMEAHEKGWLHRAVSVFIFSSKGEFLLQRRTLTKYHSPGLWSNTACSHPSPGETTLSAASRRLVEEMGLLCPLKFAFNFKYKVGFENGLTEHELDHVFIGICDASPNPNADEVMDWKWLRPEDLQNQISLHPEEFTEWFKICFEKIQNSNQIIIDNFISNHVVVTK